MVIQMIKLTAFDLDGTLLDTAKGVLESVLYTTKTMGYEPPIWHAN